VIIIRHFCEKQFPELLKTIETNKCYGYYREIHLNAFIAINNLKLVRVFYYFYFFKKTLPRFLRTSLHCYSYKWVLPITSVAKQYHSNKDNNN